MKMSDEAEAKLRAAQAEAFDDGWGKGYNENIEAIQRLRERAEKAEAERDAVPCFLRDGEVWYDYGQGAVSLTQMSKQLDAALRVVEAARAEHEAFCSMPDAGLADPDPRRKWWFDTYPQREAVAQALQEYDAYGS